MTTCWLCIDWGVKQGNCPECRADDHNDFFMYDLDEDDGQADEDDPAYEPDTDPDPADYAPDQQHKLRKRSTELSDDELDHEAALRARAFIRSLEPRP